MEKGDEPEIMNLNIWKRQLQEIDQVYQLYVTDGALLHRYKTLFAKVLNAVYLVEKRGSKEWEEKLPELIGQLAEFVGGAIAQQEKFRGDN